MKGEVVEAVPALELCVCMKVLEDVDLEPEFDNDVVSVGVEMEVESVEGVDD